MMSNWKQCLRRFWNICSGVRLLQLWKGLQFTSVGGCQMPFCSLQNPSTVLQTTAERRPRLNVFLLTSHTTFSVPKCTPTKVFSRMAKGRLCCCNQCVHLVRLSTSIMQGIFPRESCCSVLNAARTPLNVFHEIWTMRATVQEMDHVEHQHCVQLSAEPTCEDLIRKKHWLTHRNLFVMFLPSLFSHRRQKGEGVQVVGCHINDTILSDV